MRKLINICVMVLLIAYFMIWSLDGICSKQVFNPADACVLLTDGNGHGSGFAIESNLIVTAGHVIDVPNLMVIDNQGKVHKIISSWKSPTQDIGFVWIDGIVPTVKFGKEPKVLDKTYLIGTPLDRGLFNIVTTGIVSKLYVNIDIWDNLIATDALGAPGDSGCPLFDKNWNVIGMGVMGWGSTWGVLFCEPVTDIQIELQKCLSERW